MTSWTITQTSRYRAAIEGAGITEWASFIWTSDVQQFDFDSDLPEKDIAQFQRFSPVIYADKVTTPLLILHGDSDARGYLFFVLMPYGEHILESQPHAFTVSKQKEERKQHDE